MFFLHFLQQYCTIYCPKCDLCGMKNHIDITTDYVHRILNGGLGAKPPEKNLTKNVIKTPPD